jgi:hypothetical protein
MSYEPKPFKHEERVLTPMRECPLATVVSIVDGQLAVSHVPLLACERDGTILLLGAVTKANQHQTFGSGGVSSGGPGPEGSRIANGMELLPDGRIVLGGHAGAYLAAAPTCPTAAPMVRSTGTAWPWPARREARTGGAAAMSSSIPLAGWSWSDSPATFGGATRPSPGSVPTGRWTPRSRRAARPAS